MKRGREEELQDTCNSNFKRKRVLTKRRMPRRAPPPPDFWSPARKQLLLREVIEARQFRGSYQLFPLWDDGCFRLLLNRLEVKDAAFKSIRPADLQVEIKNIRTHTTVGFSYSEEVPQNEHDLLIYNAFHEQVKAAPLGRDERNSRNLAQQQAVGVTVNLNSQRMSSHTTNIGSSSGSFSNVNHEAQIRSSFLVSYKDELDANDPSAYSKLLAGGNMGVIEVHCEVMGREAFVNTMVDYSRAL